MLIKQITLQNFRQFKGKQELVFATNPDQNVMVLLGDNTFGKTTILQAFNWCLFDEVDFPKDSNPDFLLNLELAEEQAGVEQKLEVYVELLLEHNGIEYMILRKRPYVDRGYGNWVAMQTQLTVVYKEDGLTKPVREGEEQQIINSILPKSLSGYFFFDTERVSDISTRKDLTDAVQGLLGLAPVANARKHLGSRTAKSSAIGYWNAALDLGGDQRATEALDTIERENSSIESMEEQIKNADRELENLNAQKAKIEDILRENQNTAELQRTKQDLEEKLTSAQTELAEASQLFMDSYNTTAVTYFMLPLMDRAEKCLVDAQVDDRGLRGMTEASIRDIVKRGRCICGAKIEVSEDGLTGNDAYMHILEELAFLPPAHIGTEIRNFKQILAAERRGIEQFYPLAEQQYKEIQQKRTKIADMEDQIARIDNSIFGKENMSSYEADLNRIKENVKAFQETKASCNQQIGASKSAIESAQKVYDGLVTASERNQKLITYLAYAEKICTWIDESYAEREQQMRNRLQERVNEIFSQMYHGQRRVQIDKQYHVTLFSQVKGKEVITGESEGLKRVKNFAFIAGLVDLAKEKATIGQRAAEAVSWENEAYPLVMDAPFSNADETHIKNISTVLPTVANQVIMFVMEKDWQYAEPVMAGRVGKYCKLKKFSESYTQIEK